MADSLMQQAFLGIPAAGGAAVLGAYALRFRRKLRGSRMGRAGIRPPIVIGIVGMAVLVLAQVLAIVLPQDTGGSRDIVGTLTAPLLVVGFLLATFFVNRKVDVREDHFVYRRTLGTEKTIWYRDIVEYPLTGPKESPTVSIRTADGTTFSTSYRTLDMIPLLEAIVFHEKTGQWPPPQSGGRTASH